MKKINRPTYLKIATIMCVILYIGDILFWHRLPIRVKDHGLSLTFNSMMDHLLHGRFDVDPDTVGKEGFLRDGHVYAYWGMLPAFFRLPLLLLPNGLHIDITRLSCAVAAILMFCINLRSIQCVTTWKTKSSAPWVKNLLLVAVSLTGVQICFLRPSLYQEVCLWSLVFGMMFVHWAIRACLNVNETSKALIWMSFAAVAALLTRVSMGIGAYATESLLGLLVLGRCWRNAPSLQSSIVRRSMRQCAVAAIILFLGLTLTAGINFERWGNPLTFANYDLYLFNADFPNRLARTEHYGLFNVGRIPLGLIYFFFPIWVLNHEGHLLFQEDFTRLIDAAELPPSSFFLTDGLFLLFGALFLQSLVRRNPTPQVKTYKAPSLAIIAGLSVPALLMLMAISMNYRYRAEFYPLIMFMGFMGASSLVSQDVGTGDKKWLRSLAWSLVILGVIASHVVLVLYDVSDFGPASELLKKGIVSYYQEKFGF